MSDVPAAQEVVRRLGRASHFTNDSERQIQVPLACEMFKETLLRGARNLLADAAGRPVLTSKSCDGTPITVAHHTYHLQPGGKRVKTVWKQGVEFLACSQFIRTDIGG